MAKVFPAGDVPNNELPIKITLQKDIYTVRRSIEFKLEKMIVLSGIRFAMPREKYLKKFELSSVDYSVLFPQERNVFSFVNGTPIVSS